MDQSPITDDIARQRRLDAQDYANELAGLEAGRQSRFLGEGRRDGDPRRHRDRQAFQDRLTELMADPVYRAHYKRVMDRLSEAERAADAALARLNAEIETAEQGLADMEDRAARLPDGTMVFRDAQGIVRTADGTPVDPVLAETIIWTGREPTFEEHQAQRQKIDDLHRQRAEVDDYRNNTLGHARDRMEDRDNPPKPDELDDMLNDIDRQMPSAVKQHMPEAAEQSANLDKPTAVSVPTLG